MSRWCISVGFLLLSMLNPWALGGAGRGEAAAAGLSSVLLKWSPPVEGTEYLTGYQVKWTANADGSGGTVIDTGLELELRVEGLPPGKVFFFVRGIDFLGQEGEWSATTTRSVKPAVPATMGGMTVLRIELVR